RGSSDGEREAGLQVRLLEDSEHSPGIRNLELGVEVDLPIHGIHEAVEALAGVHVPRIGDDYEFILGGKVWKGDADAIGYLGGVQFGAVEGNAVNALGYGVDKRRGSSLGRKLHHGGGSEDRGALGQIQGDVVGLDVE